MKIRKGVFALVEVSPRGLKRIVETGRTKTFLNKEIKVGNMKLKKFQEVKLD